jgi:hypothetical protein
MLFVLAGAVLAERAAGPPGALAFISFYECYPVFCVKLVVSTEVERSSADSPRVSVVTASLRFFLAFFLVFFISGCIMYAHRSSKFILYTYSLSEMCSFSYEAWVFLVTFSVYFWFRRALEVAVVRL